MTYNIANSRKVVFSDGHSMKPSTKLCVVGLQVCQLGRAIWLSYQAGLGQIFKKFLTHASLQDGNSHNAGLV